MLNIKGYTQLKSKVEQIAESVKTSNLLSNEKENSLPYAYPCESYMESVLSNRFVRKALQHFVEKYCTEQIQLIKKTGRLVTDQTYPTFNSILKDCYKSLNMDEIPEVYIASRLKGINALSVGTDSKPIILFSPKSIMSLPDGELKFMIGHELGHILQKNLMCHTIKGMLDNLNSKSEILGPIASDLIDVPLNQWYRCAEYTADRAGLICARNLSDVKSLFARLEEKPIKETNQLARYFELSNIHPMYENRIKELERYVSRQ